MYGDEDKNGENSEKYTAQELSECLAASHQHGCVGPAPHDDPRHVRLHIAKSSDNDGGGNGDEVFNIEMTTTGVAAAAKKK